VRVELRMSGEKPKAIYFTRFEDSPNAGGGCRRFSQILNDLRQTYDITIVSTRDKTDYSEAIRSGISLDESIKWDSSFDAVERYLLMGEYWAKNVDFSRYQRVFLDDPVYFRGVVIKSRSLNIPVVGVCHNIETLADGQVSSGKVIESLKIELETLSLLDLAVTISYEETVLLTNLDINSHFYPYYPVECIENRMKAVRNTRGLKAEAGKQRTSGNNSKGSKQLLFMGSLGNLPTKIGLERLLAAWLDLEIYNRTGYELLVSGFGSEQFLDYENKLYGISVLGALSEVELDKKLSEVDMVVVYQGKGSGALTKINEMLIAGVPILANQHAIRSYTNLSGLVVFSNDINNLASVLSEFDSSSKFPDVQPLARPDAARIGGLVGALS
jgi:glycosyltransferase involved in cell wall biosynthesis